MRSWILALVCASAPAIAAAPEPATPARTGATAPGASAAAADFVAEARRVVATAARPAPPWDGPRTGPHAQAGKRIAIVDEDLRNGGILGVTDGLVEASTAAGWQSRVFDCGGTPDGRRKMLADALDSHPDGLVLVGGDARSLLPGLQAFAQRGIPVVGWHVAARPGPVPGTPVAMNVSTDPLEVARVTALAAVAESDGHAGVVVFTDGSFELPRVKADAMAAVVRACAGCRLLEVRDVAISRSKDAMPAVTRELLARYGSRWTHALAINDIYFDYAAPVLTQAEMPSNAMAMLSAGDGSESAFLRIRTGSFQTGTVAEPVNLHGWQLIDELNRLFAGQRVTGYVFPGHLVTADNVAADGGDRLLYDPNNGYRDVYRRIWQRP